ncbi:hypothetical protein M432DRAFT_400667 [Thermoascus aurantiacus ATCC 26904]|mgnify:CR=1 FL=1
MTCTPCVHCSGLLQVPVPCRSCDPSGTPTPRRYSVDTPCLSMQSHCVGRGGAADGEDTPRPIRYARTGTPRRRKRASERRARRAPTRRAGAAAPTSRPTEPNRSPAHAGSGALLVLGPSRRLLDCDAAVVSSPFPLLHRAQSAVSRRAGNSSARSELVRQTDPAGRAVTGDQRRSPKINPRKKQGTEWRRDIISPARSRVRGPNQAADEDRGR